MTKLALACTLHNPNGEMLPFVKKTIGVQKGLFSSLNIVATNASDKKLLNYLKKRGVNLKTVSFVPGGRSNSRKQAIKMALTNLKKGGFILHIDYDRFLHWIIYYSQELEDFVNQLPSKYDFLSVGRTKRAFLTHPKVQQKAENWTNKELERLIKTKIDTPSGCHLISKKMAEIIALKASENKSVFITDGEWPALAYKNDLKIGLIRVEGLEFETPDFHQKEIDKLGSEQRWLKKHYENKQMATSRWQTAKETVQAAKEVLT